MKVRSPHLSSSEFLLRMKSKPSFRCTLGATLLAAGLFCAPSLSPHAAAQVQLHLSPTVLQRHLHALSVRRRSHPSALMQMLTAPLPQPVETQPVTRLLIKLRPGIDHAAFAQQFSTSARNALPLDAALIGNRPLLEHVRLHAGIGWSTFEVPAPEALQPTIDALRKNADVMDVEPDYPILKLASPPPPDDYYWGKLDWQHTYAVWGLGSTTLSDVQNTDSNTWNYSWSMDQVSAFPAWSAYPGHYHTALERVNLLKTDPSRLPVVGVIDTGIDMTHPDFSYTGNPSLTLYDPNNPIGYNFAANTHDTDVRSGGQLNVQFARSFVGSPDGYQGDNPALAMDHYGHGTGVASIIAAASNNALFDTGLVPPAEHSVPGMTWDVLQEPIYKSGLTGLGFPAQIVPIKVIDTNNGGSDSDVIDAIEYACADWTDPVTGIVHASPHCSILNMSLALDTTNYPKALQDAVDFAWNHGTLIIAAAGNDGGSGQGAATPRYPARCDKVLSISATTYDNPNGGIPEQITSYSDYGDEIGVAGPGGDLQQYLNNATGDFAISPIPEYIAPFLLQPTYTAILNDPNGATADSLYANLGFAGPYVGELPGTSFAAPHVTGLAALYASEHRISQGTPGGPQTIVNAIERGADSLTGNAGYETTYGWGRINAAATILGQNNRGAVVGGCIGRVRYIDTVIGNITVSAQVAIGTGRTYFATSDPDGLYHLANLPASETGTIYNVTTTVFGSTATRQVTILPGCDQLGINLTPGAASVTLKGLAFNPSVVAGSRNVTGTLTLSGAASSDTLVKLSTNNVAAKLPSQITVPAGASSQTFPVTTVAVQTATTVKVTATGNGNVSGSFTVRPIGPLSVTLANATVKGGSYVRGTLTLEAPAGPGPITVTFTSTNTAVAATPATITLPVGMRSAYFVIRTIASSSGVTTIKATANGITKSSSPLTVTK